LRPPQASPSEFVKKLREDLPRYDFGVTLPVAAVGAAALALRGRGDQGTPRPSGRVFALVLLLAWCVVTLGGVLAFEFVSHTIPGHRFLAFCLAVPVLVGVAVAWVGGWLGRVARPLGVAAVVVVLAAFAFVSLRHWVRTPAEMDPVKIEEASTAADYLAAAQVPATRPVVFLVANRDWSYTALEGHMIRASLPADRVRSTYLYAGSPRGYLERRPTARADGRTSGISAFYFRHMQGTYTEDPVAIMLGSFDDAYFASWQARHPETMAGPGVAVIRGPLLGHPVPAAHAPIGPFGTLKLGAAAVGLFGLMWLVGIGWALAGFRRWARPLEVAALAPAVGIAALVCSGVLVDRAGIRLAGAAGATTPLAVAAIGWVVALLAVRRGRGSGRRTIAPAGGREDGARP
jgi:hypothetical protein